MSKHWHVSSYKPDGDRRDQRTYGIVYGDSPSDYATANGAFARVTKDDSGDDRAFVLRHCESQHYA